MKALKSIKDYRGRVTESGYITRRLIRDQLHGDSPSSYRNLIERLSFIRFRNPNYYYVFRGQANDYFDDSKGTLLPPSIFRGNPNPAEQRKRFLVLEEAEHYLLQATKKANYWLGNKILELYQEVRWAVLQHYEVCATPLLDVTPSLNAALAFSKRKGKKDGFLYVLALPKPYDIISYSTEDQLVNIDLRAICPPLVLRPHYQEARLIGTWPLLHKRASNAHNASCRLIAKYHIEWKGFWNGAFRLTDPQVYFPKKDQMATKCRHIKKKIEK